MEDSVIANNPDPDRRLYRRAVAGRIRIDQKGAFLRHGPIRFSLSFHRHLRVAERRNAL